MDAEVIVPGHGPVTDKAGVVAVRDYLAFVDDAAGRRQAAGVDAWEAAREIADEIKARPDFGSLGEFGRIAVNVDTVYRHLDPGYTSPTIVEQFKRMAALEQLTGVVEGCSSANGTYPNRRFFAVLPERIAADLRTARTQPAIAQPLKMNHWMV